MIEKQNEPAESDLQPSGLRLTNPGVRANATTTDLRSAYFPQAAEARSQRERLAGEFDGGAVQTQPLRPVDHLLSQVFCELNEYINEHGGPASPVGFNVPVTDWLDKAQRVGGNLQVIVETLERESRRGGNMDSALDAPVVARFLESVSDFLSHAGVQPYGGGGLTNSRYTQFMASIMDLRAELASAWCDHEQCLHMLALHEERPQDHQQGPSTLLEVSPGTALANALERQERFLSHDPSRAEQLADTALQSIERALSTLRTVPVQSPGFAAQGPGVQLEVSGFLQMLDGTSSELLDSFVGLAHISPVDLQSRIMAYNCAHAVDVLRVGLREISPSGVISGRGQFRSAREALAAGRNMVRLQLASFQAFRERIRSSVAESLLTIP